MPKSWDVSFTLAPARRALTSCLFENLKCPTFYAFAKKIQDLQNIKKATTYYHNIYISIYIKTGGSGGNLNIDADGSGLGGLNIKGFSPDTIKKFKKLLSDNNIDLSKLDLGNLSLGGGGGGAAGGAAAGGAAGGGGIHKFDGKDSLQPAMCDDSINDRYGVGKHFVRGTRDVGFAIVSEAEAILDPLLGFITHGVGQGLKALLCAIEDGFSDFGSDFDSATDIAKHGLVNFFKLQGPHPVLGIPIGIGGIAGEAVKAAVSIAGDAVGGVANAVNEVITNLG